MDLVSLSSLPPPQNPGPTLSSSSSSPYAHYAPAFPATTSLPTSLLLSILAPITLSHNDPRSTFYNWARTYVAMPARVFVPTNQAQCAAIVELARREGGGVRAVGAGHSPSDLACTNGSMIRMDKLNRVISVSVLIASLQLLDLLLTLSFAG